MHLASPWTYCGKIKTTLPKRSADAYLQETILVMTFITAYTQ